MDLRSVIVTTSGGSPVRRFPVTSSSLQWTKMGVGNECGGGGGGGVHDVSRWGGGGGGREGRERRSVSEG